MLTAAGVAGFFLLFGFVIWLGFRGAKQAGRVEAHNDVLKAGAKTDAETQDILARPPADKPSIVKWLRGSDQ